MEPVTTAAAASAASPYIAGGIAAAGALGGSMLSSAFNWSSANKQMAFQERMAGSAYQRTMEDLRKAGLNPMLAAKLGGAAVPPGAGASAGSDPGLGQAVHSALAAANIRNVEANTRKANAEAGLQEINYMDTASLEADRIMAKRSAYMQVGAELQKTYSQRDLTDWQRHAIKDQIEHYQAQIKLLDEQARKVRWDTWHSAQLKHKSSQESQFWQGWGGDLAPYLQNLGPSAKSAADVIERGLEIRGRNRRRVRR